MNSDEKSSRGTNWPKLYPENWSVIVVLTVNVNGDVETPARNGMPCTVNTSPFLYPKPLSVILTSLTTPLVLTVASTFKPLPDPPVADNPE